MEQAKLYLQLLDPIAKKFLFACFDYRKMQKAKTFYGSLAGCQKHLEKANQGVYCVYVTVNETRDEHRKKESIVRCRAIWVEDDTVVESPRSDWPIEPSMVIESSPGKYHYYWLTSTTKFDEWNSVMETMVVKYGCDNKAKDIARVLRLPGFVHRKNLETNFVTRIIASPGHVYSWLQIKSIFPPAKQETQTTSSSTPTSAKYSETDTLKSLLSSENYHGSLTSIAMSLTNRGVSRDLQYNTLFGLMNAIPPHLRRPEWEARSSKEHLYECIDSAITKFQAETEDVKIQSRPEDDLGEYDDINFPPGLMGTLCQEIFEMSPYPNKAISLSGAVGLCAGITGRRYNVMGMGLNLYIAILADSGIGKAALKDSINEALRGSGGELNLGATFIGRSRFTGPKAIFDMLVNGMSRICIIEEAGLMNESTAGDQSGISRVTLDLFTSSGVGKWAGDEGYSSKENSIPSLHSPALSIVSVSTPKSFLKALKSKQAEVSGEVARLWMIRTIGLKPYFNRGRRGTFSKPILDRLNQLIKDCLTVQQADSKLEVVNLEFDESYYDDADKWVDLENKYKKEGDNLRRTLCSRAWAKIIKIASVISIFNGKKNVGDEEYKWAHYAVRKELDFIQETFTHESSDDLINVVKSIVAKAIIKAVNREYKSEKKNSQKELATKGIFTAYNISQILLNNHVLTSMDDETSKPNPKTGLEKCLAHMVRTGLLSVINEEKMKQYGSRSKVGYKITADFELMMAD